MVALWLLIGLATALVLGSVLRSEDDPGAEAIVRRRYARGEIDRATYERMLDDLRGAAR